jgi:hypothetical protein
MKFFNIDLHISVIADIKNIFESMGHQVDSLSLSGHSWVFNKNNNDTKIINAQNWKNIDESMCDQFYETYRDLLKSYDAFICAYPPAFSLLYEKFNKPIIVVAATRYEYPFTNSFHKWTYLNKYLKNKNIIKIVNNKFDKRYCELFTNSDWKYIPSLCDYTGVKYNKKQNKSILFSKKLNINNLINKDFLGKYSWKDLYSYKSIVHIPYNYSTMSIFEQYTANVPLLFPTKKLLLQLFMQFLAMSEISFRQILGLKPESLFNNFKDPNIYSNINTFYENIDLCDFYDSEWMPFITYFNKIEDIENIIENLNCIEISANMTLKNIERKQKIYSLWKEVLDGF